MEKSRQLFGGLKFRKSEKVNTTPRLCKIKLSFRCRALNGKKYFWEKNAKQKSVATETFVKEMPVLTFLGSNDERDHYNSSFGSLALSVFVFRGTYLKKVCTTKTPTQRELPDEHLMWVSQPVSLYSYECEDRWKSSLIQFFSVFGLSCIGSSWQKNDSA